MSEQGTVKRANQPQSVAYHTALADYYAILALFLQYPTEGIISGLQSGAITEDIQAVAHELDFNTNIIASPVTKLVEAGRSKSEGFSPLTEKRLEYTRLFNHPDHPLISLFEGVFIDSERVRTGTKSTEALLFINPAALDAERCYRNAGLTRNDSGNIPADCISTELEFLAHLHIALAQTIINSDKQGFDQATIWLEEFKRIHESKWIGRFFKRCQQESVSSFYQAVGELGTILLDSTNP